MIKGSKILFVWTAAEYSVHDVANGYYNALLRAGFELCDYRLNRRMAYHSRALGEPKNDDVELVSRLASENLIVEALRQRVDFVFIVSGMLVHPDGVWLLARSGIPTFTIFTESPYDDDKQLQFSTAHTAMKCATHERTSAKRYGWTYARHAYDPQVHYRPEVTEERPCDVIMVGTGWDERRQILSAIDWTGIDLRLLGTWHIGNGKEPYYDAAPPDLGPLEAFIEPKCVDNRTIRNLYRSAKICLNMHRAHPSAESINPRGIELAACEAFQISDNRAEVSEMFPTVPIYASAGDLEEKIRYYLANDSERAQCVAEAYTNVQGETFDRRVDTLMSAI
jgi:spore maturation protein CgeB